MDDGEDEDESDEEYSDDDDMSWKVCADSVDVKRARRTQVPEIDLQVRRSAAKCLEAVISTRHSMLVDFYKGVSPQLIQRFKEREENVKVDIFHAYIALLRQTKTSAVTGQPLGEIWQMITLPLDDPFPSSFLYDFTVMHDQNSMEVSEDSPLTLLTNQVPSIVKAIHRLLKVGLLQNTE